MGFSQVVRRAAQYVGLGADDLHRSDARGGSAGPAQPVGDELVVIVVFVPTGSDAAVLRQAAAEAGAGAIGQYRACSFSTPGQGRFEPLDGANPTIGAAGRLETVAEERIEVICPRQLAGRALRAMLDVHPYEVPAHHVYAVIDPRDL